MKTQKWFLMGLPIVFFAGWASAVQPPSRPLNRDAGPPRAAAPKSDQARFLKVGEYYLDTSRIVYAERRAENVLVYFNGGAQIYINVTGEREIAAMLRWLDSESFSPPPAQ